MSPNSNPFLRGYQNLRIDRSLCITYEDDCPPVWRPLHPSQVHLPDEQIACKRSTDPPVKVIWPLRCFDPH